MYGRIGDDDPHLAEVWFSTILTLILIWLDKNTNGARERQLNLKSNCDLKKSLKMFTSDIDHDYLFGKAFDSIILEFYQ
jgi:hypothetical protein